MNSVWNRGDLDRLPEFFASTFEHGGRSDDVAGLRAWHERDAATWADQHFDIVTLVAEGQPDGRVAMRWRAKARHVGQWGPVAATGKTIEWDGVHFFTLRDGKITQMWAMADVFGKATQLGAVIDPPK